MRVFHRLIYLLIFFSILLFPVIPSYAGQDKVSWGYIFKDKQEVRNDDSKIGPNIQEALNKIRSSGITRENYDQRNLSGISLPNVKIDDSGSIQSYVFVKELDDNTIEKLKELGMEVETSNESYKVIQGWIPFHRFEAIEQLDFVLRITTPDYAFPRTGSVNTEGDSVMRSDDVRSMFGITGSGVKVGVISDGIDNADSAQATDDLPDIIEVNPFLPGSGDEGTALLEIIHDIAPGADLAFSGAGTNLEFIDAIEFHVNNNADIIIDDLGFLGEPYFEDGPVAESAKSAVQNGVVFVSAAGNGAIRHYQNMYVDTNPEQSANEENPLEDLHDFGLARGESSDISLSGLIAPGRSTVIVLQWNDDPQGNVLDGSGDSSNDYDLLISENSPDLVCTPSNCSSTTFQDGNDDPFEVVAIENTNMNDSLPFDILVNKFSGQARILEIYTGSFAVIQEGTPEDSVFGHPAAEGVLAIGAVPASDPDMVEDFSARGPSTIFFPSFEERNKPDMVAPDNVSVTGAGGFTTMFAGTSAAAPHVAGVVALLLEADSTLTPSGVEQVLEDTTVDIDPQGVRQLSRNSGLQNALFDTSSGFGLVDALAAVSSVLPDIENMCDDGVDNDGDGNSDCNDSDCSDDPACSDEDCGDGIDNDQDGFTDCIDPDCEDALECAEQVEICDDGIDNDNDNATDCVDMQCQFDPACVMEDNGGDDGSSGGCTVISDASEAESIFNFLLILVPLAGLYILRKK